MYRFGKTRSLAAVSLVQLHASSTTRYLRFDFYFRPTSPLIVNIILLKLHKTHALCLILPVKMPSKAIEVYVGYCRV